VSRNRRNALPSRGKFVKVAVAGAPYQRKVDLEAYAGYDQLLAALQDKFTSHFTVRRKCVHRRDFSAACLVFLVGCCLSMTDGWIYAGRVGNEEMALVDVVSGAEYVPTYEDKDGDWMLVGDVPWRSVFTRVPSSLLSHPPLQR
jgi:auxin-responsive protein IAA